MSKIDLHLHSKYSERPSEWFMQRLGAKESYTEPEYIYNTLKKKGMDFITITDHNKIDGAMILKEKYPDEVIVGVESTTYFPEDGCKIHVLIYGINEEQFRKIQILRKDIYLLREYLKMEGIAHSVAHATYSVNGKLKVEHLEKLILLFDVFEGINGGRNYLFNRRWMEILQKLSPEHIEMLYKKHKIVPFSETSWLKGFTAGSDDHAGLFLGETFTEVEAESVDDVIEAIKEKKIKPFGRHNDYKSLAFSVYKIAYDFAKSKGNENDNSIFLQISQKIFEPSKTNMKEKIWLSKIKIWNRKKKNSTTNIIAELINETKKTSPDDIKERLEILLKKVEDIADDFFKKALSNLINNYEKGDLIGILTSISSVLPGVFMSVPLFSSLNHMYSNKNIISEISSSLSIDIKKEEEEKILWFTDTLTDLNGVSEILKEVGWIAHREGYKLKIVSCLEDENLIKMLPPNVINIPHFFKFKLPHYEDYTIKVPSFLKTLEILSKEEPTKIYISTPGPVGLFGLIFSKLLNVESIGVYHTDFVAQISDIVEDESLSEIIKKFEKWFYSSFDKVKVYNKEYEEIVVERGIDREKIEYMRKGINFDIFYYRENSNERVKELNVKKGINLLYVGRVSKDKNMDFLLNVYGRIILKHPETNLIIVGDGPYFNEFKDKATIYKRVYFAGRIQREELPYFYSFADIFVFPSTTDTFGNVVMEAQACGLPAIVSDKGGPKNIIMDGETGLIAEANNIEDWVDKIEKMMITIKDLNLRESIRKNARENIQRNYSWDKFFESLFNKKKESMKGGVETYKKDGSIVKLTKYPAVSSI